MLHFLLIFYLIIFRDGSSLTFLAYPIINLRKIILRTGHISICSAQRESCDRSLPGVSRSSCRRWHCFLPIWLSLSDVSVGCHFLIHWIVILWVRSNVCASARATDASVWIFGGYYETPLRVCSSYRPSQRY